MMSWEFDLDEFLHSIPQTKEYSELFQCGNRLFFTMSQEERASIISKLEQFVVDENPCFFKMEAEYLLALIYYHCALDLLDKSNAVGGDYRRQFVEYCKKAIQHLKGGLKVTYVFSITLLGEFYLKGLGTSKNIEAAMSCFKDAAQKGHKPAKKRLADCVMMSGDRDGPTLFDTANRFFKGCPEFGFEVDFDKGMSLLKLAAIQKYFPAQQQLIKYYFDQKNIHSALGVISNDPTLVERVPIDIKAIGELINKPDAEFFEDLDKGIRSCDALTSFDSPFRLEAYSKLVRLYNGEVQLRNPKNNLDPNKGAVHKLLTSFLNNSLVNKAVDLNDSITKALFPRYLQSIQEVRFSQDAVHEFFNRLYPETSIEFPFAQFEQSVPRELPAPAKFRDKKTDRDDNNFPVHLQELILQFLDLDVNLEWARNLSGANYLSAGIDHVNTSLSRVDGTNNQLSSRENDIISHMRKALTEEVDIAKELEDSFKPAVLRGDLEGFTSFLRLHNAVNYIDFKVMNFILSNKDKTRENLAMCRLILTIHYEKLMDANSDLLFDYKSNREWYISAINELLVDILSLNPSVTPEGGMEVEKKVFSEEACFDVISHGLGNKVLLDFKSIANLLVNRNRCNRKKQKGKKEHLPFVTAFWKECFGKIIEKQKQMQKKQQLFEAEEQERERNRLIHHPEHLKASFESLTNKFDTEFKRLEEFRERTLTLVKDRRKEVTAAWKKNKKKPDPIKKHRKIIFRLGQDILRTCSKNSEALSNEFNNFKDAYSSANNQLMEHLKIFNNISTKYQGAVNEEGHEKYNAELASVKKLIETDFHIMEDLLNLFKDNSFKKLSEIEVDLSGIHRKIQEARETDEKIRESLERDKKRHEERIARATIALVHQVKDKLKAEEERREAEDLAAALKAARKAAWKEKLASKKIARSLQLESLKEAQGGKNDSVTPTTATGRSESRSPSKPKSITGRHSPSERKKFDENSRSQSVDSHYPQQTRSQVLTSLEGAAGNIASRLKLKEELGTFSKLLSSLLCSDATTHNKCTFEILQIEEATIRSILARIFEVLRGLPELNFKNVDANIIRHFLFKGPYIRAANNEADRKKHVKFVFELINFTKQLLEHIQQMDDKNIIIPAAQKILTLLEKGHGMRLLLAAKKFDEAPKRRRKLKQLNSHVQLLEHILGLINNYNYPGLVKHYFTSFIYAQLGPLASQLLHRQKPLLDNDKKKYEKYKQEGNMSRHKGRAKVDENIGNAFTEEAPKANTDLEPEVKAQAEHDQFLAGLGGLADDKPSVGVSVAASAAGAGAGAGAAAVGAAAAGAGNDALDVNVVVDKHGAAADVQVESDETRNLLILHQLEQDRLKLKKHLIAARMIVKVKKPEAAKKAAKISKVGAG